ncbi:uncharacterized protein EAE98_008321 [Botrytis deweyae]|uniref:Uncharacterized protein n=2 Tax=Botrytis TaxID=33196 RepID=A0A4Z1JIA9_9HELO|nr:uncharacterized protein EAE98_008321 [Botrytis deweyae]KAF7922110.1 hypothetical protein EAE98_008321 [Botrytis deweyae]KAF7929775.1 hypothetical protein EAE99_004679 [Botrytis elliptica]TGO73455.1 hypothetical protein BELL_0359g00010 [Botrytis elliptica]
MGSPDYSPLPRESTDSDRYIAPSSDGYRTSEEYSPRTSKSRSVTINYVLILRIMNLAFGSAAFALFVTHGYEKYIGADVFLMLSLIFNTVRILHTFVSSVFHVTVEISRGSWQSKLSVRPNGAKATNVVDFLLASGLASSTIGGMATSYENYLVVDGIVIAFFAMAIQYIIALPVQNQTFMLKFHFHRENDENREEFPGQNDAHRIILRDDGNRQTPENLV